MKVLRALAEHRDMSLGDVIEGIVLSKARRRFPRRPWNTVGQLKRVYGLELGAADSHGLAETGGEGTTNHLERSHSIVLSGPDAFRCSERERPFRAASGATGFATATHLADVDSGHDAQYH